jgi:hypothetical protein
MYGPSTFFRLAYEVARRTAQSTIILSAKHGAVRTDQVIEPYEQTLVGASRSEKERWADMVYGQLETMSEYQAARSVLWLAGENYRAALLPRVRSDKKRCVVPMEGLAQGEQLSWLTRWLNAEVEHATLARPKPSSERPSPPSLTPRVAPKADDFRRTLAGLKAKAAQSGVRTVEITAGELHALVGGYPGGNTHRMPTCCSVMRQEMRPEDTILAEPPKGAGASLKIRYRV